jgi:predicted house-cleaning noncanonical NTP pyrophosphatase (MazG superfamily)
LFYRYFFGHNNYFLRLKSLAPFVDEWESRFLEAGVQDPDLRPKLFQILNSMAVWFHNEFLATVAGSGLAEAQSKVKRNWWFSSYLKAFIQSAKPSLGGPTYDALTGEFVLESAGVIKSALMQLTDALENIDVESLTDDSTDHDMLLTLFGTWGARVLVQSKWERRQGVASLPVLLVLALPALALGFYSSLINWQTAALIFTVIPFTMAGGRAPAYPTIEAVEKELAPMLVKRLRESSAGWEKTLEANQAIKLERLEFQRQLDAARREAAAWEVQCQDLRDKLVQLQATQEAQRKMGEKLADYLDTANGIIEEEGSDEEDIRDARELVAEARIVFGVEVS